MHPHDEIRLLLRGIATLKKEVELYAALGMGLSLLETSERLDNLYQCLIATCWKVFGQREEDKGSASWEK